MRKTEQQTQQKKRLRNSYITSTISITLVLFLLGLVGLLVLHAAELSRYVKENIGFSVFLKQEAKDVDVLNLQKMLDAQPYVKETRFITKEEAAVELRDELGEDFMEILEYNPLPASIDVRLHAEYANMDSVQVIERKLSAFEEVMDVSYQKSLIQAINYNVRRISIILLGFGALLFIISTALINNTIRLTVYAKRFIINTQKLVGATRAFIRRPFVLQSVVHGITGAILAIFMLIGVISFIDREFQGIISTRSVGILFFLVVMAGIVLTALASLLAVNKYLRLKEDDLYY